MIKNYGECCCRVRSNGKAGIFNIGSSALNLSNSVWQVLTCRCSQSVVSYSWEKVCFKVCHKSWITNNTLTWNVVSNCKKSAKEAHKMLKLVYGDAAVTIKTAYKWFEWFRNGCESVKDEERSGHPSTSKTQENVERVSEMIGSNGRLTIREIYEDLNISYGSVQNFLTTNLNMRRVNAKFHPPSWQHSMSHIASGTSISVK